MLPRIYDFAKIYISVLGNEEEKKNAIEGLEKCRGIYKARNWAQNATQVYAGNAF